jgi:hypothetical protein
VGSSSGAEAGASSSEALASAAVSGKAAEAGTTGCEYRHTDVMSS